MEDEAQRENVHILFEEEFVLYSQERCEKIENALTCEKGAKYIEGAYFKFRCLKNFKLQREGAKDIVFCIDKVPIGDKR